VCDRETASTIAKSNQCEKAGNITRGGEWHVAFFRTPQFRSPMGKVPMVAAILVKEGYRDNVMQLVEMPEQESH
jgi:hypothetical protein